MQALPKPRLRLNSPRLRGMFGRMDGSLDITPVEVCAIHSAAREYRAIAAKRAAKMPSSAAAMIRTAERLEALRDKLVPHLLPHEQVAYLSRANTPG